jgi:DNA-binding NarL/FixJ family response regulator
MTIRVVLADDQPLVRGGFAVFVNAAPDMTVVGEAADGQQAIDLARAERAEVVVMDVRMPGMDGLDATRRLTAELPATRVLILTTFEVDEYVFQALRAGASGFLGKNAEPDDLLTAIRLVHRGDQLLSPAATRALIGRFLTWPDHTGPPAGARVAALTEREREVVALVATGMSNEDIARYLVVSPHTARAWPGSPGNCELRGHDAVPAGGGRTRPAS